MVEVHQCPSPTTGFGGIIGEDAFQRRITGQVADI